MDTLNPLEVMTNFANAVLAMKAALDKNDEVAGVEATVAIVKAWEFYSGDEHVITAAVETLAKAMEELGID